MTSYFFSGQALKIRDCPEKFGMDGNLNNTFHSCFVMETSNVHFSMNKFVALCKGETNGLGSCYSTAYMHRLNISSALQSWIKWQPIGMR